MESSLQVGKTLLAISVFSVFVAWDIVKACYRRDKWIQGSGLTLTALSVQFLGYLDAQNLNHKSKEQELKVLLKNQLSVDNDRLVFCTFLACVLPGVAFHSSGGRWSNIAALAVSLCLHMSTEIYVLQNVNDPAFRNGGRAMFISSSVLLLVAAISLVLYIGLAIINCKFTRDRLNHKIAKMVKGRVESQMPKENLKRMLDTEKFYVFKYWAIVRGCQQEFWLVSSAFSPAVLMIVTTCVAMVVAKAISPQSLLHHESNNSVRWTLCFQCVFILTGWAILIWRWAVFLLLCVSREAEFFAYRSYIKVYGNRFFRLVYLSIQRAWNWSPLDDGRSCWKNILTRVWKPVRILVFLIILIIMLPVSLFCVAIYLLVLVHFFCWWLSKLLARSITILPFAKAFIDQIKYWVSDAEVELKTAADEILYVSESSLKRIESVINGASEEGKNSKEIVEVIKHSVKKSREEIGKQFSPKGDIYSYIGVWKMAAVAAISLIAELNYGGVSEEIIKDVVEAFKEEKELKIVKEAVEAYKKAKDLLAFLDFPDNITVSPIKLFNSGSSRAYQMSLEADIEMQKIEKRDKKNLHPSAELTFKAVEKIVHEFASKKQCATFSNIKFYQYWSGKRSLDLIEYLEDTDILKEFSMKCVCQAISEESYCNKEELVNRAKSCLGDIIACGVLELPKVLPQYCSKWAEDFKEENLIKALKLQEKFRAIEAWISAATRDEEENKSPEVTKVDIGHEINDEEANSASPPDYSEVAYV
ncbi:uncharacterized protein LOC131027620 isoform X2 [Cryptomeria japonica]|uniref:uncharacterized protein LOC131027620 isoform X2 n=1 Tax=Cryptomeria japonica TaxID=3369 RepID=UPI0027DA78B2|nr:uncharacterized protein LOC131027620 isoform X2 [Cryptomeria japonica]